MKNVMLISEIVLLLAGIVLMILGKIGLGIAAFLVGFGLIAFFAATMLRTGGYRAEGAFFNGLGGQGRQQSEVSKAPKAGSGEQPANIWDMMDQKD